MRNQLQSLHPWQEMSTIQIECRCSMLLELRRVYRGLMPNSLQCLYERWT